MASGLVEGGLKQRRQLALPFRVLPWDSVVHAVLFVPRVVGLPNSLYFLVRNEDHLDELRTVTKSEFSWMKPGGYPSDLPLYELVQSDCRELLKRLSCHQLVMAASTWVWWFVLNPIYMILGLGWIHGFSGKLECLIKSCILKSMQLAFLLPVYVSSLMILCMRFWIKRIEVSKPLSFHN